MPKLSDTKIRSAKSREKPFKLYDQDGLFLIVHPNGGRWWRQKYFIAGKEKLLSIGTYPETSLADARTKGAALRSQAKAGADPSIQRQREKAAQLGAQANTYQGVVLRWLEATGRERQWTQDHIDRVKRRFEVHFFPWLGSKAMVDVTDEDILGCLGRMQDKRLTDTARRALSENDSVFRWAKSPTKKIIKHNVVAELRGPDTLPKTKVKHHAALKDPKQVGALMRAIDAYHGGFTVRCALRFLPLVFVRPGELQWSKWDEFDLDGAEWRIPPERMKMREQHIVPLSKQAIEILRELHSLTGPDGYVFPQARNASRPISENTVNVALRACGYTKDQQTAHGFRSTASTLLNELGFNKDWIERQLAHGERDKSRESYNSAEYLAHRRPMMQSWADYLDQLRTGRKAVATAAAAALERSVA